MLTAVQQLIARLLTLVPMDAAGAANRFGVLATPARLLTRASAGRARTGVTQQCAAVRAAWIGLALLARLATAARDQHWIYRGLRHLAAVAPVHSEAAFGVKGLAKRTAETIELACCGHPRGRPQLLLPLLRLAIRPEADAGEVKHAIAALARPKLVLMANGLGADDALVAATREIVRDLLGELR